MSNSIQRSFSSGELAPALHARADLARYAIGLRTCRNMVVMRAGGVTKRPGTRFVLATGTSDAYALALTTIASVDVLETVTVVASVTDSLGNPVTGQTITWESDDEDTATIAAFGDVTATVTGVAAGTTAVRARVAALDLVSNDCAITVTEHWVIHQFNESADLVVTTGGEMEVLLAGGGGSGGSVDGVGVGAGGGGGGAVYHATGVTVAAGTHAVVIGSGGIAPVADHVIGLGALPGADGNDSTFLGVTAPGGGGGGGADVTTGREGRDGGSGGGAASASDSGGLFSGGASTAVTPVVGNPGTDGVDSSSSAGGGGGGAGGTGSIGTGGVGLSSDINNVTGTMVGFGAGGDAEDAGPGTAGTANSGDGGGGGGQALASPGGNGGAGVLFLKYRRGAGIVATGGDRAVLPT